MDLLKGRWTLRDLVDFEALLGREGGTKADGRAMRESVEGLEGAEARGTGMRVWLEDRRRGEKDLPGEVWAGARFLVAALVVTVMFLTGVGVMTGMLDRERMGFHVPMVLGVAVGLQLLVLVAGFLVWALRGRFSKGLGFVRGLLGWLVGKAGGGKMEWWRTLRLEGGRAWEALGWNLLRLTQLGAVMFSVGLMAGLLGCIWFLQVTFFWESTTPEWMAERIYDVCRFLGTPWGWIFPDWVPSREVIDATRWDEKSTAMEFLRSMGSGLPDRTDLRFIPPISASWYRFIFASIFFWGLLPRSVLWGFAVIRERKALAALDFQAKRHRELWREMMGTRRVDTSEAPRDGVLVLDVGGTGLKEEDLRGFLLRRLRVNPGEWFEVGVWNVQGEAAALESFRKAPAGVVFLAEGWALSPPRMKALHAQVRSLAGAETMIYFLVANAGSDGGPAEVKDEEQEIWRDFVDRLADASAEIFFYEEDRV